MEPPFEVWTVSVMAAGAPAGRSVEAASDPGVSVAFWSADWLPGEAESLEAFTFAEPAPAVAATAATIFTAMVGAITVKVNASFKYMPGPETNGPVKLNVGFPLSEYADT